MSPTRGRGALPEALLHVPSDLMDNFTIADNTFELLQDR